MKVDLCPCLVEGPDLMEKIENAAVIHGIWHIKAHDM
jgi:hypothetical protein